MHHAATRRPVKQTIRSNLCFLINEMISILFASMVSLNSQKLPANPVAGSIVVIYREDTLKNLM